MWPTGKAHTDRSGHFNDCCRVSRLRPPWIQQHVRSSPLCNYALESILIKTYRCTQVFAYKFVMTILQPYICAVYLNNHSHDIWWDNVALYICRYQINARTELAVRYNDISPLENHHCAVAFQILSLPECNVFANVDPEAFKQIRQVYHKMSTLI